MRPGWAKIRAGVLKDCELLLPEGGIVWAEMLQGTYDQFLLDALLPVKQPRGKVFWDIGAHVGYHSLAFAALGAKVLAFEPNPANVERLKLHVQRNQGLTPRIRYMAVAVSDADGEVRFSSSDELSGESTGGHLDRALPPLPDSAYARFREAVVPAVSIDSLIKRGEDPPDILKIDIEGAEELALRGGREFFPQHNPVLLMEIHHICLMFSIQKLLLEWGYETRLLDQAQASPSRCFIMALKG